MTDAVLTINPTHGVYDFNIDSMGDIETSNSFATAILYSLYGERRASREEVVSPERRRGWIGNDDYENGSKIWLLEQSRITRNTLNRLEDEAAKSLQWLVTDGKAVSIDEVSASLNNGRVLLNITVRVSKDQVDQRSFIMWENTGRAS